jgi:hypothetical protein
MKNQNKWEALFEGFLDLVEFTLIKYKKSWGVHDNQGANLGDIEGDRFKDAEGLIDRMDTYIVDYFYEDLENELDAYDADLEGREVPYDAIGWLLLKDDVEFVNRNKKYFDDHSWEFDVLEMIVYHIDEIDLENVFYESEKR